MSLPSWLWAVLALPVLDSSAMVGVNMVIPKAQLGFQKRTKWKTSYFVVFACFCHRKPSVCYQKMRFFGDEQVYHLCFSRVLVPLVECLRMSG